MTDITTASSTGGLSGNPLATGVSWRSWLVATVVGLGLSLVFWPEIRAFDLARDGTVGYIRAKAAHTRPKYRVLKRGVVREGQDRQSGEVGEVEKVFDYSTSGGVHPEASAVLIPAVWFVELRNVEEGFWR